MMYKFHSSLINKTAVRIFVAIYMAIYPLVTRFLLPFNTIHNYTVKNFTFELFYNF